MNYGGFGKANYSALVGQNIGRERKHAPLETASIQAFMTFMKIFLTPWQHFE